MARFYGSVKGQRGEATRLGGGTSGLHTIAASWSGAVRCDLYDNAGRDFVRVHFMPWHGRGTSRVIYDGPASGASDPAAIPGDGAGAGVPASGRDGGPRS